ncbi:MULTISPECIES: helix-turn-helix transcriptional regulator [unclassified Streptomyces]|uniref:helix-turn-helix transcriptional regulator n=1 Tax=unclassified Streptomyces TaxID=2593676 RepID=UPI002366209C|nr:MULTISPECIES: helix-turn-helix transcriptional regulator [unclassified Streptomyces]MDF3140699.1 helix-turn-helix transcriptional regulator [Streptomyces sp. T21Q-yed]WDF40043.1 helix-turn-helix transcriptional regulator [Streptomyces sp. T12]
MSMTSHREHGAEDLCPEGMQLYEQALREERVDARNADDAPCLVRLGLLQPDLSDLRWLEPVAPAYALQRLLRTAEERIADERRREERLAAVFEPLIRIHRQPTASVSHPSISVHSGLGQINRAISESMADATTEALAIQPHKPKAVIAVRDASVVRDQALLDRGGCIRTLYQHTFRHLPELMARYEHLQGDVEARTLDEVTERLLIIDRTVAFIPANRDRTLAVEIRHPAIVDYFVTTFDRLWHLATPMYPEAVQQPSLNGVTPRQRAIATLLIEGHTDAVIANRLGMNIRTARAHIAKLAATLGSESRAQLGYLIGQSGILD